jgi:hypothetical protein
MGQHASRQLFLLQGNASWFFVMQLKQTSANSRMCLARLAGKAIGAAAPANSTTGRCAA